MNRTPIKKWDKLSEKNRQRYIKVYPDTWGWVHCPACDQMMEISKKIHTINSEGIMHPSLVCPHCPFHEFVYLEGYVSKEELKDG